MTEGNDTVLCRLVNYAIFRLWVLKFTMNPDNPLAPPSPRRREPSEIYTPQSGQNFDIDPLRGDFLNNWIPACAGMTRFRSNEQTGMNGFLRFGNVLIKSSFPITLAKAGEGGDPAICFNLVPAFAGTTNGT